MSALFAVRVMDVKPKTVRLSVTRVHPDAERPAPHAVFALMLMYDPIEKAKDPEFSKYRHLEDSALAREVQAHQGLSSAWAETNAQAFVAKVTRSGPFLDIQLTHPAWGEHLRKRMSWHTTAYDMGPGLPAEPREPRAQQAAVSARKQPPKTGNAGAKKTARKAGVKKTAKAKSAAKKATRRSSRGTP